jgi:hypothetical protein
MLRLHLQGFLICYLLDVLFPVQVICLFTLPSRAQVFLLGVVQNPRASRKSGKNSATSEDKKFFAGRPASLDAHR